MSELANTTQDSEQQKKPEYPWRKAKKVAVMLSFVGKDYLGMQRYDYDSIYLLNINIT